MNPRDPHVKTPPHKVALHQIAHARAGDKGNISSIALFVYKPEHFIAVKEQITTERLREEFGTLFAGRIRRYAIDHLQALNFVINCGLEGGVNSSLNLDAHGKSFSFLLLSLEVDSMLLRPHWMLRDGGANNGLRPYR